MKPIKEIFTGTIYQLCNGHFIADSNLGLLERVISFDGDDTCWFWKIAKRRYTMTKNTVDTGIFARRHNTSNDIVKIG